MIRRLGILFATLLIFTAQIEAVDINVKLSIPQNINATAGQTVTIPINLDNIAAAFTLDSYQLIVSYDSSFFENPSSSTFQLGTLTTGMSYSGLDNVDTTNKYFTILRSNVSNPATLTSASSGSLMTFNIQVKSTATPGSSGYLNILASQGASNTEIITLSGAPDNIKFNPSIGSASINGKVSIAAVPEPSTYALTMVAVIAISFSAYRRNNNRLI
jgi:hypothetical protein